MNEAFGLSPPRSASVDLLQYGGYRPLSVGSLRASREAARASLRQESHILAAMVLAASLGAIDRTDEPQFGRGKPSSPAPGHDVKTARAEFYFGSVPVMPEDSSPVSVSDLRAPAYLTDIQLLPNGPPKGQAGGACSTTGNRK